MPSPLQVPALRAAALAFVAGVLAVTLVSVVVFGNSVERAALGSLGYAFGGAVGVYIAYAGGAFE